MCNTQSWNKNHSSMFTFDYQCKVWVVLPNLFWVFCHISKTSTCTYIYHTDITVHFPTIFSLSLPPKQFQMENFVCFSLCPHFLTPPPLPTPSVTFKSEGKARNMKVTGMHLLENEWKQGIWCRISQKKRSLGARIQKIGPHMWTSNFPKYVIIQCKLCHLIEGLPFFGWTNLLECAQRA